MGCYLQQPQKGSAPSPARAGRVAGTRSPTSQGMSPLGHATWRTKSLSSISSSQNYDICAAAARNTDNMEVQSWDLLGAVAMFLQQHATTIRVTIRIAGAPRGFCPCIMGDSPELGSWSYTNVVELVSNEHGYWSCTILLPPGLYQFKFVARPADGAKRFRWEPCYNRTLVVPGDTSSIELDAVWGQPELHTSAPPPSLSDLDATSDLLASALAQHHAQAMQPYGHPAMSAAAGNSGSTTTTPQDQPASVPEACSLPCQVDAPTVSGPQAAAAAVCPPSSGLPVLLGAILSNLSGCHTAVNSTDHSTGCSDEAAAPNHTGRSTATDTTAGTGSSTHKEEAPDPDSVSSDTRLKAAQPLTQMALSQQAPPSQRMHQLGRITCRLPANTLDIGGTDWLVAAEQEAAATSRCVAPPKHRMQAKEQVPGLALPSLKGPQIDGTPEQLQSSSDAFQAADVAQAAVLTIASTGLLTQPGSSDQHSSCAAEAGNVLPFDRKGRAAVPRHPRKKRGVRQRAKQGMHGQQGWNTADLFV